MKKTTGVLAFLTGIFVLAWVGLGVGLAFTIKPTPDSIVNFLFGSVSAGVYTTGLFTNILSPIKDLFAGSLDALTIYDWVALGSIALLVILLIAWIIIACVKKKFVYLWYIPLIIVGIVPLVATLADHLRLEDNLIGKQIDFSDLYVVLLMIYAIVAIVATLLYLAWYIFGITAICSRPKEEVENVEDIEQPALPAVATDEIPDVSLEEEPLVSFDEPVPEPLPEYVPEAEPLDEPLPEPEPEVEEEVKPAEEAKPCQTCGIPDKIELTVTGLRADAEPKVEQDLPHEIKVTNASNGIDPTLLAATIREAVRDIVRDEIARANLNQNQTTQNAQPASTGSGNNITGATFGGPLVVQYFNGGINGVTTPAQPAPQVVTSNAPQTPVQVFVDNGKQEAKAAEKAEAKEEPAPAPVKSEPKQEVKPATAPTPVLNKPVAPAPAVAPARAKEEDNDENPSKVYERISFIDRMLDAEKSMQENYNNLKNEVLSYGVKSRVSNSGDTFRLHKKTYLKITIAGKSLKLYFALDPKDYEGSTIPFSDASDKNSYNDIPLVFKVRSELSMRRAKDLIQACMEKDGLEQDEVVDVNWIKELRVLQKEKDNN